MSDQNSEKNAQEQNVSAQDKNLEIKQENKSWTYSAANREDKSLDVDEYISKTELKNDAKELHRFGKQLVLLSIEKLNLLPLDESTKYAVSDFQKQVGNIAKKRHLAFIAKCLRSDDEVLASMKVLELDTFAQLRAVANHEKNKAKTEKVDSETQFINALLLKADQQIQLLIEQSPTLDRQTIRQLVRNLQKAKTDQKKNQAKNRVLEFLKSNKIDLAMCNHADPTC